MDLMLISSVSTIRRVKSLMEDFYLQRAKNVISDSQDNSEAKVFREN